MKNILNKLRKWWRLVNLAASNLETIEANSEKITRLIVLNENTIDAIEKIDGKLDNLNQGLRRQHAANKDEESARQRDVVDIRALIAEIREGGI